MAIDGLISTYGTLGLANNIMHHNCEVVNRLCGAGGIALGLTNMPEFGASVETENLIYGRTSNPYNLTRFPGGSSGGEAAIIAAGGSPLGVGGDSGGSIREPAHYCGIAGLKPTTGRIPRTGFLFQPRDALSFKQQVGPMARCVEDLTLGMRILAGSDGRDPSVVDMPFHDPAAIDVRSLRVAYFIDNGIVPCDSAVIETVMQAVDALPDAVASVTPAAPPEISRTYDLYGRLSGITGAKGAREHLAAIGTDRVSDYLDSVLRMAERFEGTTAAEFIALSTEWDVFREHMRVFMADYDVIVSPTTSIPEMPHRSSLSDRNVALSFTYAATYNLIGWPAATVRCGTSPDGLPIGVQVAARSWREDLVQELVFNPLGMTRSRYAQPLPPEYAANAARAYGYEGEAIAGGWHVYPELAAAGLWTTPSELAAFGLELRRAEQGERRIFTQATAAAMLTPHIEVSPLYSVGLGAYLSGDVFWHNGFNRGYKADWMIRRESGDGVAVMSGAEGGFILCQEMIRAVAAEYSGPGRQFPARTRVPMPSEAHFAAFAGVYEVRPGYRLEITHAGDILQHTGNILFDEKIGGTVHIALGTGYPETGSKNRGTLHWDLISDLRSGGEVTVDGEGDVHGGLSDARRALENLRVSSSTLAH